MNVLIILLLIALAAVIAIAVRMSHKVVHRGLYANVLNSRVRELESDLSFASLKNDRLQQQVESERRKLRKMEQHVLDLRESLVAAADRLGDVPDRDEDWHSHDNSDVHGDGDQSTK